MPDEKKQHWLLTVVQWVAPLLLSAVIGYGGVQYAQGAQAQRLATIERDVSAVERRVEQSQEEHSKFPTREELNLILSDLKEIKQDVREIRRSLTK